MRKQPAQIAVTSVKVVDRYAVELTFSDGKQGRVDLEDVLWGRAFEALLDPVRFAQVSVDKDLGTVVWTNGADLSPEFLYERCKGSTTPKRRRS